MCRAAESTSYESAASRKFQKKELDYSHKIVWKLVGVGALILVGGVGGSAIVKAIA